MNDIVYMKDNSLLTVVGTSIVKLKIFDSVIRTIECWYILQMKRNLISPFILPSQVINIIQIMIFKCVKASKYS